MASVFVDDLVRLHALDPEAATDAVTDNPGKFPTPPQPQAAPQPAPQQQQRQAGGSVGGTFSSAEGVAPSASSPAEAPLWLGACTALLSREEAGRVNTAEGFAAALAEHMRGTPEIKRVLGSLQPRLPPLDLKVLRFLHKHRGEGAARAIIADKLKRDFKVHELDAMRALHLPWQPAAAGHTKAARAAELAEWLAERQADYLEQQGHGLGGRRAYQYW